MKVPLFAALSRLAFAFLTTTAHGLEFDQSSSLEGVKSCFTNSAGRNSVRKNYIEPVGTVTAYIGEDARRRSGRLLRDPHTEEGRLLKPIKLLDALRARSALGPREPHRHNRVALQVAVTGTVAFAALVLAHGADNGARAWVRPARAHPGASERNDG